MNETVLSLIMRYPKLFTIRSQLHQPQIVKENWYHYNFEWDAVRGSKLISCFWWPVKFGLLTWDQRRADGHSHMAPTSFFWLASIGMLPWKCVKTMVGLLCVTAENSACGENWLLCSHEQNTGQMSRINSGTKLSSFSEYRQHYNTDSIINDTSE